MSNNNKNNNSRRAVAPAGLDNSMSRRQPPPPSQQQQQQQPRPPQPQPIQQPLLQHISQRHMRPQNPPSQQQMQPPMRSPHPTPQQMHQQQQQQMRQPMQRPMSIGYPPPGFGPRGGHHRPPPLGFVLPSQQQRFRMAAMRGVRGGVGGGRGGFGGFPGGGFPGEPMQYRPPHGSWPIPPPRSVSGAGGGYENYGFRREYQGGGGTPQSGGMGSRQQQQQHPQQSSRPLPQPPAFSMDRGYSNDSIPPGVIRDPDEDPSPSPSTRSSDGIFARVDNSRENLRFRKGAKVGPAGDNDDDNVEGESNETAVATVAGAAAAASAPTQIVTVEENGGKIFARKRFEAKGNVTIGMTKKERNWRKNPRWQRLKGDVKDAFSVVVLWHRSLKKIESEHGIAVLTYFAFVRWLLKLNFILFLLMFIFIIVPQFLFPTSVEWKGKNINETNYAEANAETNITLQVGKCSAAYSELTKAQAVYAINDVDTEGSTSHVADSILNSTKEAVQPFLDFLQGTGFMENTVMYYGHFEGGRLNLDLGIFLNNSSNSSSSSSSNTFNYNIPIAYIVVTLASFLLSLFMMIRNSADGVREQLLNSADDLHYPFCLLSFTSWDYNITSMENAELKKKDITNDILAEISEYKHAIERKRRTNCAWAGLVMLRIFTSLFILGLLGGAAYGIYQAVNYSLEGNSAAAASFFSVESDANFTTYWRLLMDFMPSLVMTAANLLLPPIMDFIAGREKWTPLFEMKVKLIRLVFLKLASIGVLVYSFWTQVVCENRIDPCDLCDLGDKEGPRCWETYVGQQLYRLCIVNFLTTFLLTFFVAWPRRAMAKRCGKDSGSVFWRLLGNVTFLVHRNVLDLIYAQTIFWFSFFYAPLMSVVAVCFYFLIFYVKRFALRNSVPAKRSYKAAGSNSFFMLVLLISFVLVIIPVFYSILYVPPSRSCGPFRFNSDSMWQSISDEIYNNEQAPQLQNVLTIISSTTVAVPIIILLILIAYYFQALSSAHKALGERLKEQLVLESQDKHFLMRMMQHMQEESQQLLQSQDDLRQQHHHKPKEPVSPGKGD